MLRHLAAMHPLDQSIDDDASNAKITDLPVELIQEAVGPSGMRSRAT